MGLLRRRFTAISRIPTNFPRCVGVVSGTTGSGGPIWIQLTNAKPLKLQ
jgi:hypothetical protein